MSEQTDDISREYNGSGVETASGSGVSGYFSRTFVSFKNPVYRLYYFSMVGHWSSMNMQMLARNLLIFRIVNSEAVLGVLALANAVPMIALTLPGGVWADRIQKKTIIQIGQVSSIFITLGTMLAILFGYLGPDHPESWWVLVASGALQGGVMGFIMPARSAIISEITGPKHLMNAISLNNMGMNFFRIFSPALAGFLVDLTGGFWVVYAVMTAMVVMSWLFILPIKPTKDENTVARTSTRGNSFGEILEGWRYIRGEKTILLVLIFAACGTILGSPYSQLLPVFTEEILKVSATNMGVLVAVSGVGAIIGSFILANLTNKKRGWILMSSALILGISLVGFALSKSWYLSLALIVFVGMGSTVQNALGNSLVQYYTDAAYRGRIMSFFMMSFGVGSLGTVFAGMIAEVIGTPITVAAMAVMLVIVCFGMMLMTPRVRKLD
jgi:MFS family permease